MNAIFYFFKKYDTATILFWVVIAGYASLFLINPHLGPTDDFVFLRTLQSGKPLLYYSPTFPYYDTGGFGRFTPLASMEYNAIALFSNKPFWYFFYSAAQFLIFMFFWVRLLKGITSKKWLIYASSLLFIFLPGFTIAWFRLQLPERNVIFFGTLLLWLYAAYQKKQKTSYLVGAALLANIIIYYKETAIAAILPFAIGHFIFSWKTADKKLKITDGILAGSTFAYLLVYYFYIYIHKVAYIFAHPSYHPTITFFKNVLNYGTFSDPILIFLILPFTTWRMYKIFIVREPAQPLYDSMLLAASGYASAFFLLGFYGPYYLIPAYTFAIPALLYFYDGKERTYLISKILLGITLFFLATNSIPSGLHYLTYNKYLPVTFNRTLDFLAEDIVKNNRKKPVNIFLEGIDRNTGLGTYFIFGEFLQFQKLTPNRFDLKSTYEPENPIPYVSKIQLPFSVFTSSKAEIITSGDYLVVSPQETRIQVTVEYLKSLEKEYAPVFAAEGTFAFPNLTLKTLTKYLATRFMPSTHKDNGLVRSENLLDLPNYYVFIKK